MAKALLKEDAIAVSTALTHLGRSLLLRFLGLMLFVDFLLFCLVVEKGKMSLVPAYMNN